MKLFSSEKDLIWKVVNAVLLIWVLISVVVFLNVAVVENVVKPPKKSYRDYKVTSCVDVVSEKGTCARNYQMDQVNQKDNQYYNYRSILGSIISFGISAGALYALNRPKKSKKK